MNCLCLENSGLAVGQRGSRMAAPAKFEVKLQELTASLFALKELSVKERDMGRAGGFGKPGSC